MQNFLIVGRDTLRGSATDILCLWMFSVMYVNIDKKWYKSSWFVSIMIYTDV